MDSEDLDGEDHLDVGSVSDGQSLSDAIYGLEDETHSEVEYASDSEDPSDVDCVKDVHRFFSKGKRKVSLYHVIYICGQSLTYDIP